MNHHTFFQRSKLISLGDEALNFVVISLWARCQIKKPSTFTEIIYLKPHKFSFLLNSSVYHANFTTNVKIITYFILKYNFTHLPKVLRLLTIENKYWTQFFCKIFVFRRFFFYGWQRPENF